MESSNTTAGVTQGVDNLFDMTPWPWQRSGVIETIDKLQGGQTYPFCVAGPTGTGKSNQMIALIRWAVARGKRVVFFVNRNLLYSQTTKTLDKAGISYGCRGAAFEDLKNDGARVQICSVPTENARVFKVRDKAVEREEMTAAQARLHWQLPDADLVLIDEIHMNAGDTTGKIISEYMERGAQVVCYTATPLGISHLCSELIVSGSKVEGRKHKSLVPAVVFGSPELDHRKIKPAADGGISEAKQRAIWDNKIFGYILQEWKRVNPDARMALGFGPDVAGSTWLAHHFHKPDEYFSQHDSALKFLKLGREWEVAAASEFYKHGVSAAHIDGSNVWHDGKEYKGDKSAREDVLAKWQANEIKILWNRWVMREGLDYPDLYHGILACVIGKVTTYDQIVGRFIRYSAATPEGVVITDHGGNYWRHGSPNEDRDWQDLFDLPVRAATDQRMDAYREKRKPEPIICPKCGAYRTSGPMCWKCKHQAAMTSRLVLQSNGSLKQVNTSGLRPRRTLNKSDTQQLWDDMYWRAHKAHRKLEEQVAKLQAQVDGGDTVAATKLEAKQEVLDGKLARAMNFNQLYGKFFLDNGYFPPKDLDNMPLRDSTWYRKVRDTDTTEIRMPPISNQSERPVEDLKPETQTVLDLDNLPEPE